MVTATGEFIDGGLSETGIFEYEDGFTIAPDDFDPPVVSISPSPGVFNQPISVVISLNESGTAYYQIDDGSIQAYTGPVLLIATASITYWGIDSSGNESTHFAVFYDMDVILSTLSVPAGYYAHAIDAAITNENALPITYSLNGGAWQSYTGPIRIGETVSTELQYRSGAERVRTAVYEIDETPLLVTPLFYESGSYRTLLVDFEQNLPTGKIYVSVNNGVWFPFTAPFNLPEGSVYLSYYAVNNGHTYPTVANQYKIGQAQTFVDFSPSPVDVIDQEEFYVTLTGKVEGDLHYQVEDGEWLLYTAPVLLERMQCIRARVGPRLDYDECRYSVEDARSLWDTVA